MRNLPLTFDCSTLSKVRGRFCKILWPSQNIWTLTNKENYALSKRPHQNTGLSKYEFYEFSWEYWDGKWAWGNFVFCKYSRKGKIPHGMLVSDNLRRFPWCFCTRFSFWTTADRKTKKFLVKMQQIEKSMSNFWH